MHKFQVGDKIQLNSELTRDTYHYCNSVKERLTDTRGTIVSITHYTSTNGKKDTEEFEIKWDICKFPSLTCDGYPMLTGGVPWLVPVPSTYEVVYHNKKNTTLTIQGKVYE